MSVSGASAARSPRRRRALQPLAVQELRAGGARELACRNASLPLMYDLVADADDLELQARLLDIVPLPPLSFDDRDVQRERLARVVDRSGHVHGLPEMWPSSRLSRSPRSRASLGRLRRLAVRLRRPAAAAAARERRGSQDDEAGEEAPHHGRESVTYDRQVEAPGRFITSASRSTTSTGGRHVRAPVRRHGSSIASASRSRASRLRRSASARAGVELLGRSATTRRSAASSRSAARACTTSRTRSTTSAPRSPISRTQGAELIDESPRRGMFGLEVAFVHPDSVHGVLSEVVSGG